MMATIRFDSKLLYRLYSGDREYIRCITCQQDTEHIFGWYNGQLFTCLVCHPEAVDHVPVDTDRIGDD